MDTTLSLTEEQHKILKDHLYPGDNLEAVAVALCGRHVGKDFHRLFVHEIMVIPYEKCTLREKHKLVWTTESIISLLDKAAKRNMAILKIHSHPSVSRHFSRYDDESDTKLFSSIYSWVDNDLPHASAIMLPDGSIFGRSISPDGKFNSLSRVTVVGDDIVFWDEKKHPRSTPEFARRHIQVFGTATYERLSKLKIGVIGCSGTGSLVVEQLARLGVGELVLVDPDHIEEKNLNRIPNATMADAREEKRKVDVLARAIKAMELGTVVQAIPAEISTADVVKSLAECDVVFGCMDGVDGRHILNRLASFYLMPYFDLGVKLIADGKGGVDQVCATVHYLQPGRSSLMSRKVYTQEQLFAANLKKTDPVEYEERLKSKYITGVNEERPAVISVNMLIAALAVNEFLARIHPYRQEPNGHYAIHGFSLSNGQYIYEPESEKCSALSKHVGRGHTTPLLDMPELS